MLLKFLGIYFSILHCLQKPYAAVGKSTDEDVLVPAVSRPRRVKPKMLHIVSLKD